MSRSTTYSRDGTPIAFSQAGEGPPVVLVDGAFGSRTFGPNPALAKLLTDHFTVFTYDRRGRGESGDASSYDVEREVEDLDAVIAEAGTQVNLYGISSGAGLALQAAVALDDIRSLALFEAPFVVDDTRSPISADYLDELEELVAADRRGAAVKLFMRTGVGLAAPIVTLMQAMPRWSKFKAVAGTVPYDARIMAEHQQGRLQPPARWAGLAIPTLVIAGSKSPEWMLNGTHALADALPRAQHHTLEGQTHMVQARVLAPVLIEFFAQDRETDDDGCSSPRPQGGGAFTRR